jgi:hypothetical protein
MFATLAAMNFISIWVLLSFYVLYMIGGFIVACILPHGPQKQDNEKEQSADIDLGQLLTEVKKSPDANGERTSVDEGRNYVNETVPARRKPYLRLRLWKMS